jgi:hypothetical protein
MATIEQDFEIPINAYAWVGLDGFVTVIDTIGGVDQQPGSFDPEWLRSTWAAYTKNSLTASPQSNCIPFGFVMLSLTEEQASARASHGVSTPVVSVFGLSLADHTFPLLASSVRIYLSYLEQLKSVRVRRLWAGGKNTSVLNLVVDRPASFERLKDGSCRCVRIGRTNNVRKSIWVHARSAQ